MGMPKIILIAGGSGMIGSALTQRWIAQNKQVRVLTRSNKSSTISGLSYHQWDISKERIDEAALEGIDAIVNLTGAGIADKRWSASRKKEILDSRVLSTRLLHKAAKQTDTQGICYVGASAIGIYGDQGTVIQTEDMMGSTDDFMVEVCRQWEEEHQTFETLTDHLTILRIGIVLSNNGGALVPMQLPTRFGNAPYFGNGQQVYSWIHIHDMCKLIDHAIERKAKSGIYNAAAPNPSTNKEFMQTLGKGKAVAYPVPSAMMKLIFGEMSRTILNSTAVSSKKIESSGFRFDYPTIESALLHLREHKDQ